MSRQKYDSKNEAALGAWGYRTGRSAPRITVRERQEEGRDVIVEARWYVNGKPKTKSLGVSIRDDSGRVVPALRREVEEYAEEAWRAVQSGDEVPEFRAEQGSSDSESGPMTLKRGMDIVCDPKRGRWTAVGESERDDRVRACQTILRHLDGDRTWDSLREIDVQGLWVEMEEANRRAAERGKKRYGFRTVQRAVETLLQATKFLRKNHFIPKTVIIKPDDWQRDLRAFWEHAKERELRPHRPRHSREELSAIVEVALDEDGDTDPRFQLLMRLGVGLRLGVAARPWRSDLDTDSETWTLDIHGRGKKKGVHKPLREDVRVYLQSAMVIGYLSDLEAAYQAGRIDDYRLFPAGRLRAGKARADGGRGQEHVGKSWMHDQLVAVEKAAGVEHAFGRGWHGLRRAIVDEMKRRGVSREAMNAAMGWVKSSRIADEIYADPVDEESVEEGEQAHHDIVHDLAGGDE